MACQQAEAEGTLNVENAYGTYIRLLKSEPKAREHLAAKREDGVTDEDPRWCWGLHDLDRRMMGIDDESSRAAVFLATRNTGIPAEKAAAEMRIAIPVYGDPTDTEHHTGNPGLCHASWRTGATVGLRSRWSGGMLMRIGSSLRDLHPSMR